MDITTVHVFHPKGFNPEAKFKEDINNPHAWLKSVESLETAIALFRPTLVEYCQRFRACDNSKEYWEFASTACKLIGPYSMLAGYALECLFKGIIVARGNPCVYSHNLIALAEKADIGLLSYPEEFTLRELEKYTTWRGRYPTPTKWSGQYTQATDGALKGQFEDHNMNRLLIEIIDPLHSKSKGILVDLISSTDVSKDDSKSK